MIRLTGTVLTRNDGKKKSWMSGVWCICTATSPRKASLVYGVPSCSRVATQASRCFTRTSSTTAPWFTRGTQKEANPCTRTRWTTGSRTSVTWNAVQKAGILASGKCPWTRSTAQNVSTAGTKGYLAEWRTIAFLYRTQTPRCSSTWSKYPTQ